MILPLKFLATAGLAASVATGGALATRVSPEADPPPASATTAPGDTLVTLRVGEEGRFTAGEAGQVTVIRTDAGLDLKDVAAAAGWLHEVEQDSGFELEVKFFANGRRIDLELELEGVSIRVRVRDGLDDELAPDDAEETSTTSTTTAPPTDPAPVTVHTAGEAGTVTVAFDDGVLVVADVQPNAGWVFDVEERRGDEVEVKFRSGLRRIDFKAELEDGRIQTRVEARRAEVDIDEPEAVTEPGGKADEPRAEAEEPRVEADEPKAAADKREAPARDEDADEADEADDEMDADDLARCGATWDGDSSGEGQCGDGDEDHSGHGGGDED